MGAAWMDPVLFASIVADSSDLVGALDLVRMSSHLSTLHEIALYFYVDQHVWPSKVRTAFFLEQPLEEALYRIQTTDGWEVFKDRAVYGFLTTALHRGALARKVFTAVSTKVIDATQDTPCIRLLLEFVLTVLDMDPSMAPALNDCQFFSHLVKRRDFPTLLSFLVSLAKYDSLQSHFPAILYKCITFLRSGATEPEVRRNSLRLLESFTSTWYSVVARVIANVSQKEWRTDMGRLLKQMLTSNSVELVLLLEGVQQLSSLIFFALRKTAEEDWTEVLGRLRVHWPQRVAEVLNEPAPIQRITDVTCPITLAECVYPVVASDGHTYERDALLEHMRVHGPTSPITRCVITYHLFPNRAVYLPEVA